MSTRNKITLQNCNNHFKHQELAKLLVGHIDTIEYDFYHTHQLKYLALDIFEVIISMNNKTFMSSFFQFQLIHNSPF